jgi:hypothetical protein
VRASATSLGWVLSGALTAGCGLFFGDVAATGGGGGAADGGAAPSTTSSAGGGGEGGAGGKGDPGPCSASLESLGAGRWLRTFASAKILDVAVVEPNIVAVGTAMPGVHCGVPFDKTGLVGERIFLLAVDPTSGETTRVVDLGRSQGAEVRLSHGGDGEVLVAWTRQTGLCVMRATDAAADCPTGATLSCELTAGSFSNIGVAATNPPVVLFRSEGVRGQCVAEKIGFGADFPSGEHVLLRPADANVKVIGTPSGTSMGLSAVGDGRVRLGGICAENENLGIQTCSDGLTPPKAYYMFTMETDVNAATLEPGTVFTPFATVVNQQFGFVAPSPIGIAYSGQQNVMDARRVGWSEGVLAATPLAPLKIEGTGDPTLPTGVRSAEAALGGGQILAGVTHADPLMGVDNAEVFSCGLPQCAPYAFWVHVQNPAMPDPNPQPAPSAVVANDMSGAGCSNSAAVAERGLLVDESAVVGGSYRCGRPAVAGVSRGVPADANQVNAFLARLTPD